MQVQFLDAPDFAIDRNGVLTRRSVWLLSNDDPATDISTAAAAWAGTISDPWKQPTSDGSSYTPDDSLQVTNIKCTALDSRTCRVEFTGCASTLSGSSGESTTPGAIQLSEIHFERRKDLSEYKTAIFYLPESELANLPAAGDLIAWAGSDYRCESLRSKSSSNNLYEVELTAVNTAIQNSGIIASSTDNQNRRQRTGCWLVSSDALEEFMQNNALHAPAVWAGENFYIASIKSEPANSAGRTAVTLTAREVEMKLLEKTVHSEIVSFAGTTPVTTKVWHSRWLAGSSDKEIFANMLGAAAEWTDDENMIVCKITPLAISECEYEYTLEARYAEEINPGSNRWWRDNDMSERREYHTRVGEMRLSPLQCGYYWRHSGHYLPIYNWDAQHLCPFDTMVAFHRGMINRVLRLLEVVEVSYLRGTSGENIQTVVNWFQSQRIENKTIAGISGNFLRYDLEVQDITDSRDRPWTKISQTYRLAPENLQWNSTYWK